MNGEIRTASRRFRRTISSLRPAHTLRIAVVESSRAVAASLGWLKAAGSVVVISCRESDVVSPSPRTLVDYLTWHDIKAEAIALSEPPRRAGPAIVEKAVAAECDLIVFDAYMHARP